MLDKKIKKAILEAKDKKDRLIIEENLVKTRISTIIESKEIIENFEFLPEGKKMKIAVSLMEEIRFLDENQILNEQLMDFLGKIFGNSLGGIVQTIVEPLVNSILSGLGMPDGFLKNTLISLFTSNPLELAKALKSCEALTKLVAQSMVEGMVMMLQQQQGLEGKGYTFLRNALGGAIKDTKFIQNLEGMLEGVICDIYRNFNNKASDVYKKITPELTT